jgi:hypothetical protein
MTCGQCFIGSIFFVWSSSRSTPARTTSASGSASKPLVGDAGKSGSREVKMLWTIFVILLVLWLLGIVSSYTLGGFIHLLLVIALVVLLIQLISGRRPVV